LLIGITLRTAVRMTVAQTSNERELIGSSNQLRLVQLRLVQLRLVWIA
jgi:hypothetical protein